jgi:hypothetical protein
MKKMQLRQLIIKEEGEPKKIKYVVYDFINSKLATTVNDSVEFYENNNDKITAQNLKRLYKNAVESLKKLADYHG